ncbi:MAG: helix-turn-helix transcriptional regulator [Bacteroidales bacterium]|nr:helix-turn-helix transcriptional regulator [Bacteroidales bacterium]MBR4818050.1 helix-turn-helix transcriptional regulator [Bacteroidales bacterium]MBR5054084.1 helix-turn-helix transcriptional regulator [Bacteroidales bacterium]
MRNTIKLERVRKSLTQQELADILSVSRQTIMAIESGKFNPSVKLALKMAAVFECDVKDLFSLEDGD